MHTYKPTIVPYSDECALQFAFISPCLPTVGVYIFHFIMVKNKGSCCISALIMCVECIEVGSFLLFLGLLNQREVSFPC